jgi:hypothetical protein
MEVVSAEVALEASAEAQMGATREEVREAAVR